MTDKNILGSKIRKHRKNKNLSISDLSNITGIDELTVARQENGQQNIDENEIKAYSKALNISINDLFHEAEQLNSPLVVIKMIKQKMKFMGINKEDLSYRTGLSLESINDALNDKTDFPINNAHLFSKELGIPIPELLGFEVSEPKLGFGDKLSIAREYRGVSIQQLVESLNYEGYNNISEEYIQNIEETNSEDIDFRAVMAIGKILHLNIDYFKDKNSHLIDYLL